MKFKLEDQDGVYFLDVYYVDTLKGKACYPYGTIIFDTKRKEKKYYLIPSKKGDLSETFVEMMENLFVASLAPRDDNGYPKFQRGARSGYLSYDVKERLINIFELYEIELENNKDDEMYYVLLNKYNRGYYSERKMFDNC